MPSFLIHHRHEPEKCGVAFAAFKGHESPLRHGATFASCAAGGPSAQIEQTMFDYGDVKLGQTIKTQIPVKNVGDTQLAFAGEPRVEVVEGC